MSDRVRAMDVLVPPFKIRVETALAWLREGGFDPIVWETYRSPKRAAELVANGRSRAKGGMSMHCYCIATDVLCAAHRWECRKHGCGFFEELGIAAEREQLTWGGRWRMEDLPHIQALPVRLQDRFRAVAGDHRQAFLESFYAGLIR